MELCTIFIGALVALFFIFWRHLRTHHGKLESLGVPIIPHFLSLGSGPLAIHKHMMHEDYLNNFKKYGMTFGHYEGVTPVLNTIDPEIIKSVAVKNFDSFHSVVTFDVPSKYLTLDISSGDKWKALRKALSPTFTSGKLKGMLEPMSGVADSLLGFVEEKLKGTHDGVLDMRACFQGLAMDTISKCAFGLKTDANRNPKEDVIQWGMEILQAFRSGSWLSDMVFHFIFLFPGLASLVPLFPPGADKMRAMTADLIKRRKEMGMHGEDFIARLSDIMDGVKSQSDSPLTEEIVAAQGIIFYAAGFETTANTLSTMFYHLAKNPDIQEQLADEIIEVLQHHDGKIDHETINDMHFLDACINENLRINGPVSFHLRVCEKDTEVKPGFVIKKGTRVDMHIYAAHHWPEFFAEPEVFRPDRFLKENSADILPYTYRPFGGGPRLCIGQRFALVEIKIAAAKLISKYRIVSTPETKLDFKKGDLFLLTYPEMKVKLEPRN